jgi:hypothetical protein
MYYLGTMQAAAMQLMSRKMMAAMQLEEGSISEEGLAAMGGGSDTAALINAISNVIDPKDIERNWGKTSGGTGKKKLKQIVAAPVIEPEDEDEMEVSQERIEAGGFDSLDFDGDDDEESDDASEFEREEDQPAGAVAADADELTDDMDFDDDDLAEMFANLKDSEGDELDW